MALERIYGEGKLFKVVTRRLGGPSWLPKGVQRILGDKHTVRGCLTKSEAQEIADQARSYKGQEQTKVRSIFD